MQKREAAATFEGNPLTLVGPELSEGDKAPDAVVLDTDLNEVRLSDFGDKVRIVLAVPSLDTPVCDAEARRFNEEAAGLGDDVTVLTISMDLPFAQKRWCSAAGIERVKTLSDHRDAAFGEAYGVLIDELRLLARTVFVVDRGDMIRYVQRVKEITHEPDYDEVLQAARDLTK